MDKESCLFGDRMRVKRLGSRSRSLSFGEIEAVYRQDGAALERVAIAIVGDEQLGCDAVQDAFVLALRSRASFRGDAPLIAWLWRIVINEARKRRARELGVFATDPTLLESGSFSMNGAADRARLRALIAGLPERQRLVLFLRHYADLDYATIAETLEITTGTVAATLSTARDRLREQLQEVHEWEL
jgi:RNA polymerase sigma-70 factor (ECF subfamily)